MDNRVRRFGASFGAGRLVAAGLVSLACIFIAQPAPTTVAAADKPNVIGMNTSGFSDWGVNKALVDVIKLGRPWETLSGGKPRTDANGWPLEDARVLLWADLADMQGTYKLSFLGQALVSVELTSGHIASQSFDPMTNTTSADVVIDSRDKSMMQLVFQNTSGGVKNVKLIRPGYSAAETFTTPYKTALSKTSVIRLAGINNINDNVEVNWSDRRSPSYFSWAQSGDGKQTGVAWEYAIRLCNELKRDAWLQIPPTASDDYVVNLARLWLQGDTVDGVTYPGLDPSLNLYVEYGNEVWNPDFLDHRLSEAAAVAEVRNGGSPLNYDGATDQSVLGWRWTAKRTKEISDDFRAVFGNAAMGTRVRPVLSGQQTTLDVGREGLLFIDNVYGSQHPVNYYLYGFGGAAYYNPDNNSNTLTLDTLFATLLTRDWIRDIQLHTDWAAVYGLKHVAYEGGPTLDTTGHSDAVKVAAVRDPRITTAIVNQHEAWTANGGDLFMYFIVAWDYQWGFTDNMANLDTPKYRAIDEINRRAAATLTYGTPLPAVLNAGRWSVSSGTAQPSDGPVRLRPVAFGPGADPSSNYWTAYTLRSESPAAYQLSVTYSANQDGELKIVVDGTPLEAVSIQNSSGSQRGTPPFTVTLGAGIHSVRLQSTRGEFSVQSIQVEVAVPATAVPSATPLPTETPAPVATAVPPPVETPMPVDAPPPDGEPAVDEGVT